jgi:hypothetical protein
MSDEIKMVGTFAAGKMYYGNGRWAKVMKTKMYTRPDLLSVAFGRDGETRAFEVWSTTGGETTLTLRECREAARDYILRG